MSRTTLLAWLIPAFLVMGCGNDSTPADPETMPDGGDAGPDGADAGEVVACAGIEQMRSSCQALPERFDASTTLAKGCYLASKSPVIAAGVTLTLAPGVTILFAEDTGLAVDADRSLIAAGTAEEPICLTGDVAQRGSWKGLNFGRTEGADFKLDHVTIEYAGSTKSDSEAAAIKAVSDSRAIRLSLTNTTIRESQGYGLYFVGSVEASAFENNVFTKNTLGPASVDSDVAGLLDAASDYTGNDVDEVYVRTNRIEKNGTWAAINVPYHLSDNLNVQVPWTVDAPNTLIMAEGAWISINGDEAALNAVGTATQLIVFTGAEKVRGFWEGITFGGSNNAANELDYVTVEYAGSTAHNAYGAGVAAEADSHGVTLSMSNTTIHECEGFGLNLVGSTSAPVFEGNTLTKNGLGPVCVGSDAAHLLDPSTSFTGNDVDHVLVRTNRVGAVSWQDLGVPYELDGNLHVDLVWTIEPGVTLLLAKDSWINMDGDDAALHAVGTAQKPITISGIEKTAGYWHALTFGSTLNSANEIAYATVEYGGSANGGGEAGMINASSDSHGVVVSVHDSTIRHSNQFGIWLGYYAQYNDDIESSNTFEGNAQGDVLKEQ